jgi:hypothetical protein
MPDSAPITISMSYTMSCQTFRFAVRNERFVLAFSTSSRPEAKRPGRPPVLVLRRVRANWRLRRKSCVTAKAGFRTAAPHGPHAEEPRGSAASRSIPAFGDVTAHGSVLRDAPSALLRTRGLAVAKLRKSAAKALESLACVTLCAGAHAVAGALFARVWSVHRPDRGVAARRAAHYRCATQFLPAT